MQRGHREHLTPFMARAAKAFHNQRPQAIAATGFPQSAATSHCSHRLPQPVRARRRAAARAPEVPGGECRRNRRVHRLHERRRFQYRIWSQDRVLQLSCFPHAAWKNELQGDAFRKLEQHWRSVVLLIVDEIYSSAARSSPACTFASSRRSGASSAKPPSTPTTTHSGTSPISSR